MPRKPRMYLPNIPCHVIQRGNNREACFFAEQDYLIYLDCLKDACNRHSVAVHAYVLMTNHVHLLLTPQSTEGISRVMQSVGRRYVQYINKTYRRWGTLWESRHKASLINAEEYLLACYLYIELNPVAASMVVHPGDYRWSSYRHNAYRTVQSLISEHELYQRLGSTDTLRSHCYRELFRIALAKEAIHAIRTAAHFSMPLGHDHFKKQVERMLGRSIGKNRRGRPRIRPLEAETLNEN